MSEPITPDSEIREAIIEEEGEDAFKCYHCGKCASVCPWFQIAPVDFPVYRMAQEVKLGALDTERSDIWRCVGCEACLSQCPKGVNTPKMLRAVRRILAAYGALPDTLQSAIAAISTAGNPFGLPEDKRTEWTQGIDVKKYTSDLEFLYFSCCVPAYDPIIKKVAKSTAEIFNKAELSFGILGEKEKCCCDLIRRGGAEEVFQSVAQSNIDTFREAGVKKIITTSPHCFIAFKNDYRQLGADFEVFHAAQIFYDLLRNNKLKPNREIKKKVLYHDPCTLGRQS
ncbi:MAG: (Fe-S)-binding protein, partial [Planctomycetota bacterium]